MQIFSTQEILDEAQDLVVHRVLSMFLALTCILDISPCAPYLISLHGNSRVPIPLPSLSSYYPGFSSFLVFSSIFDASINQMKHSFIDHGPSWASGVLCWTTFAFVFTCFKFGRLRLKTGPYWLLLGSPKSWDECKRWIRFAESRSKPSGRGHQCLAEFEPPEWYYLSFRTTTMDGAPRHRWTQD